MSNPKELIAQIPEGFKNVDADGLEGTVQYNFSETMHMVINDGECTVHEGAAEDPTVTMTLEDSDLVDMLNGELDGISAFMTGKLQLDGDIMFAQRLAGLMAAARG